MTQPQTGRPGTAGDAVIEIQGLVGGFRASDGRIAEVLHDVSYSLRRGAMTAVVGETGSGKSVSASTMLQIQPANFVRTAGRVLFEGDDLFEMNKEELRKVRGRRIGIVFQDARAALNPVIPVGRQLRDVAQLHLGLSKTDAHERVIEMLKRVSLPDPERRARQYAHEFSGGMAQRAMIAMALIAEPEVLILDEPTTGLDVTIQADIMDLIVELTRSRHLSVCLITHDLGVVAETCDDVVVMNAGCVVEVGSCQQILTAPAHEYTQRLLSSSRRLEVRL